MKIDSTKLELLTAQKGMTFSKLAENSGVSRQSISTVKMRGTCKPTTLVKLASALNVDPADIIEKEKGE